MNKDENKDKFDILRFISKKPEISQRKLSKELGLSLGKLKPSSLIIFFVKFQALRK